MTVAPVSPEQGQPPKTYAEHVAAYAQAGWPCILPVPTVAKHPPPVGYTGAEGRDTDPIQLVRFATERPFDSIALRMPAGVIGIDVDQYVKKGVQKRGAETLAHFLALWGPLPPTWTSTAREPGGPSRIYLFRVPVQRYATKLTAPSSGDVEVIQRHHRYAVVWPSPNPETGTMYRWYDPAGLAVDAPPKPFELPELPPVWVAGLADGATDQGPASADRASGDRLLGQLRDDWRPECAELTSARFQAVEELGRADAGSRHDTMTARVHHVVQVAAQGHAGAAYAITELTELWTRLTPEEDRAEELERMLLTSARKAVTLVGDHQVPRDPCLMVAGFPASAYPVPQAAPGSDGADGEEGDPADDWQMTELPRWASVRELIGTQSFDPRAGLDQTLAEAVLQRTYPLLRYAFDAKTWLLRCPQRWEQGGKLSAWAVAQVASLMPLGDPTAEKGSEQLERAQKRSRLMSTGGARAVAGKMEDLVAGGAHPVALALSDLDADPEVLWAGGMPYDLRQSHEGPALAAGLDVATPHLHTAAVMPEPRPTPLWDAFLEAVWPDPEIRAWAVRVLSISLTGYADRALPILLGETGRGKTQVVHLLMSVLGTYAHAANPKLLSASTNEHDTIVFDLKGARLSFIDEAPSEAKAGQERLKQLTGGAELTGRRMNQDPITFRPTHTFILTANDEPTLTDPAVRSRVRLIPCEGDPEAVRLARKAIGHVSGTAWRTEAPGVLAAMMTESAAWLAEPTSALVGAAPENIRYLAEHLGAEQDPVGVWVTEETEPSEEGTASRELYQAFTASCLRNNLRRDQIPSETKWGRILTRLGYGTRHTEHGKRRPLVIRTAGFLPGMPPPQPDLSRRLTEPPANQALNPSANPSVPAASDHGQVTDPPNPDGLGVQADGLLTGSQPNPSGQFPQVNPSVLDFPDGSDGFTDLNSTHTHALRAQEERPESPPNPSAKPKREPSPEAKARAAQKRAEKRATAIAEASGPAYALPVVVLRDPAGSSSPPRVVPIGLADADALLATLTGPGANGELTVDVEHTGYPIAHADYALRTIQLGDEGFSVVLDAADQAQTLVACDHLAKARVLHAHSATADLVPLADAGLVDFEDAMARMIDTAVQAKLADPTSTDNSADLKGLAKAVLREAASSPAADEGRKALFKAGGWLEEVEVTTPAERSGWANADHHSETMLRYDGSDVLDCSALARRLPALGPEEMARERLAATMTARIAFLGVRIDGDQVRRLIPVHEEAKAGYAKRITGAYGVENPGSPQQLGNRMVELGAALPPTATGRPSVKEGVLEMLVGDRATGPRTAVEDLARLIIDWREHDTALKLFLRPYDELVRRGDGRARPTIYTLGAKTGRMSCVRPNLQQLPREGGFRACITADPGHVLISADFASVELRVAAALSRCPSLTAIVNDPSRDIHLEIARLVWGPQVTKKSRERYQAKRKVFGRMYGQGVDGMANTDGAGVEVAKRVIYAMDALMPGFTEWARMVQEAIKAGHTAFPAYSGRTIHLPKGSPHAGPNYCIQGTARELLIDALERWNQTPWAGCTLWPVHDEVVVMVPEDQADDATTALVECMTSELAGVPIVAEASKPSYAWSDSV